MTTNATQLTVDLATLAWGRGEPDDLAKARRRAGVTLPCVVGFVAGCAAGAVLEVHCGLWAQALPVALAVAAVPLGELWGDGPAEAARRTGAAGGHSASARTTAPDHGTGMGQQTSHGRDQGGIPNGHPSLAAKHARAEADLGKLASAWHIDLDLGPEIEVVTDMTNSRLAGFHQYQPTLGSLLDLFARLRRERIVPA